MVSGRPQCIANLLIEHPIVMLDVGARNDTLELPRLADLIVSWGFEPNIEEYQKLISGQTDRFKATGLRSPRYRSNTYLPLALADVEGEVPLYITKGAGAVSLLKPNPRFLERFCDDVWVRNFEVKGGGRVKAITLDRFMVDQRIERLDYVKLDTQGSELNILKASASVTSKISVIKTEVGVFPMYEGQYLFHDVSAFLYDQGFELVDIQVAADCRVRPHHRSRAHGHRQLIWADAIYAKDLFRMDASDLVRFKQGLVLAELGYLDYAESVLKCCTFLSEEQSEVVLSYFARPANLAWRKRVQMLVRRLLGIEISRVVRGGV